MTQAEQMVQASPLYLTLYRLLSTTKYQKELRNPKFSGMDPNPDMPMLRYRLQLVDMELSGRDQWQTPIIKMEK